MKTTLLLLLTTLLCAPALAQSNNLEMLWQSESGMNPSVTLIEFTDFVSKFDATGDGKPDLVMTRDDEQGNLRDILVRDAATGETFWRVEDVAVTLGFPDIGTTKLWGFADVNGDGEQEALFTTETQVRAYDPSSNELSYMLGLTYGYLVATDFNGDGHEELIIFLPDTRQVQIWTWSN